MSFGLCLKVCNTALSVHWQFTLTISDFADPPKPTVAASTCAQDKSTMVGAVEEVVPDDNPPTTLIQWAVLILNTPDPVLKVSSCHAW